MMIHIQILVDDGPNSSHFTYYAQIFGFEPQQHIGVWLTATLEMIVQSNRQNFNGAEYEKVVEQG